MTKLPPNFNVSQESHLLPPRGGNEVGRVQTIGSSSSLCMVLSYPIFAPPYPASHDRKNFLTSFPPLGTPWSPIPSYKTLFLINLLTSITIFFFIKPISLIKIYLKLQINLSYQIKLNFSKNWIILLKCLTRQY